MATFLPENSTPVYSNCFTFLSKSYHTFNHLKSFVLCIVLILVVTYVNGATRTASVTGNWSNTATWGGNSVPVTTDDVNINSGIVVTMDANPGNCNNLTISGTLTCSGSNNLNVGGNLTNNGVFITGTGTITMNHSDATGMSIGGTSTTTFTNLYLGTSNGQRYSLGNSVTVNGLLTISNNVVLTIATNNLTLGASSTIINTGTLYNGCMIIADGIGKVQKIFTGATSFTFPIGDSSSNYSPISINFTTGTFGGGATVSVNVTKAKEPHNFSPANYFNRYWTVSQTGITSFLCNVTGTFGNSDISGSSSLQNTAEYTGSAWVSYSGITTTPNPYSFTANGVIAFGNFTGMGIPSFTTNVPSISGLTYASGHGPSTGGQSFYVNSTNLTSPFTVSAQTDFEVSLDNNNFQSTPLTLPQSSGVVNNVPVYVRLKAGLAVGTYSNENIVCSSVGATNINVIVSGTVTPSAYYSITSNNWTTNTTWAFNSGGGAVPAGAYPQAGDNVYIEKGYTVTVNIPNAACFGLTLGGQYNTGTLTFTSTGSPALAVSGVVQIGNTDNATSGGTITFVNGAGMTAGSLNMGNVSNAAASTLTMTAGSTLTMNGNFTLGNGTKTWTPGNGTVILNATNTLPSTIFTNFNNLTCSSGTTTMGVGLTLNGNLNVFDVATFIVPALSLGVAGATTVGNGTSGILNITNATGTKTFTGAVTIYSGGAITESAAAPLFFGSDIINNGILTENGAAVVSIAGSITNNGTYTSSTGIHTFTGSTKTIGGTNTISIPTATFNGNYAINGNLTVGSQLTVSGANILTNNGSITVSTTPSGTGGLTQGTTGILKLGGTSGITNLTANAVGNTVNYNGTGQTVKPINYYNLSLTGSGTKTISSSISVTGNLSITNALAGLASGINVTTNGMTLEGVSKIYGTWGSSSSAAANKEDLHFTATTGIVTVTDNRLATALTGLTASQSTCIGIPVVLSGVVSGAGPVYPANGETVVITINGNSQNATIAGGVGGFSINYLTTSILTGSNTITYSYRGNITLKGANDISTFLTGIPTLPVSLSIGASSNSICSGTSVTFTATPTNGGTTPSYQWNVNGINAGINSPTYSYIPGNTDAVTCILTSNASPCVTGSPATSNTVTMIVTPAISNNTIVYTNGLNGTACGTAAENSNLVLTAPTGAIFISVDFASYGTPTGDCTAGFTLGACNQTNSQTITEGYLLGNNTATIPATNAVFVDPCTGTVKRLYVKASYLKPVCTGNPPGAITGAVPSGGNGTYTYLWESSTTGSSSGFAAAASTNNGQSYSPGALTQTTWYRRTVTSGGCTDVSVPVQISVNQILAAGVTIAANPTGTICSGTSVTFTATPVNGGTTPTYQWTLNSVNVGTNSATYTNATLATGNTIACIMTSNLSCTTNNPATSNTITMSVNPILAVSVSITPSAPSVCPGTSVTFTATPTNGGTTPTYQWKVNGTNAGSNSPTYAYIPVNNDVVTCILTSNYACPSGNPATSNAVTMSVSVQIANNYYDFSTGPYVTVCATSAESGNAILTAAAGNVFVNVGFASYGMPTGTCPAFVIGGCNALTSQSVTEVYLLGKSTATIPANNTVFGDPCSGTIKHYYVQATYSIPVCSGNTPGTINGMVPTGGDGTYTYLWESSTTNATSGFINATGTNNGQNYTPGNLTQTTWYRRTVFSVGCSNISSVIQITVSQLLPVTVSIAPSANPVYAGTSVTCTAIPVNGGTTPSYQWLVNGIIEGSSSNSYTYFPVNGDAITCLLTSNGTPCTTGSPAPSNTVIMTVNSNKWKGNTGTLWNNGSNWLGGFAPTDGYDVEFDPAASNDLYLDTNHTIGNLINLSGKSLVIPPGKTLTVNNIVTTGGNTNQLYIQSASSAVSGSLIFIKPLLNTSVNATVEMYSKASYNSIGVTDSGTGIIYHYTWQYFGIPIQSTLASPAFDGSFVRSYDETSSVPKGKWTALTNLSKLYSFIGYEITQTNPLKIIFKGVLETGGKTIPLTNTTGAYDPGQNILSNPYTAAIDITKLGTAFGTNTEATIYIYNTGSYGQWSNNTGELTNNSTTITAGQYTAIPQGSAGTGSIPSDIPSMSGFLVKATYGAGSFTMNYNTVMANINPQRTPAQVIQSTGKVYMEISINGEHYGDRMWLINQPGTTHGFDNGWDGYKLTGAIGTPQLFAMEESGNYQVSTSSDMSNTYLGFQAGLDTQDTLTFTNENIGSTYASVYLYDLIENRITDITQSGTHYSFIAETTPKAVKRFKIVTRLNDKNAPDATIQINLFSSGNTVFIQNSGNLNGELIVYDMTGRAIKTATFGPYGITAIQVGTISGAYVVKATTNSESVTKRIILGKEQ